MKYDDVYPDATPGLASTEFMVKSQKREQERPCTVCGEVTRWFHREFCVFVCSEECSEVLGARNN